MKDKDITIKITKTDGKGYDIEWDKFVNVISYGPGENERIVEKHHLNVLGSKLEKYLRTIIDENLT